MWLKNIIHKIGDYLVTSSGFFAKLTVKEQKEGYKTYLANSFFRIFLISIVFGLMAIVSLSRDFAVGFYFKAGQPYNFCNLIAFGVLLFAAIIIILCKIFEKKMKNNLTLMYQVCEVIFIVSLDIAIISFCITEFSRGYFICFELFYLVFFAAIPMFKLRYNFINALILLVGILLEYALIDVYALKDGIDAIDMVYQAFAVIGCYVFAIYLRHYYLKTIINQYENQALSYQLKIKSEIDQLTGCLNRYALNSDFELFREKNSEVYMMMIDIDEFKKYNDAYSHVIGDECLIRVCASIKNVCCGYNFNLYRYGGEEFLLLGLTSDNPRHELEKSIIQQIDKLSIKNEAGYLSLSIGVAKYVLNDDTAITDVISIADSEVYLAKENGKHCVFFEGKKI